MYVCIHICIIEIERKIALLQFILLPFLPCKTAKFLRLGVGHPHTPLRFVPEFVKEETAICEETGLKLEFVKEETAICEETGLKLEFVKEETAICEETGLKLEFVKEETAICEETGPKLEFVKEETAICEETGLKLEFVKEETAICEETGLKLEFVQLKMIFSPPICTALLYHSCLFSRSKANG